jgi:DNA-binding CsgD family transcriptional regulator/N-acetylneuraminic acid mutarotase
MSNENLGFSGREGQVVRLLMQGRSNNQIAYELGISVRTVEYHLGKVYAKLGVASRSEAILKLSRAGLWESAIPKEGALGESRVEKGDGIGDDEAITGSIPMQNPHNPEAFNRSWAAAILVLLFLIVILISAGLMLFAQGIIQLPFKRQEVSPTAAAWRVEIDPGADLSLARTWHTATTLEDGRVLLVGGDNGIHDFYARVEIYDPLSSSFNILAPLYTPRSGHTATRLPDGRVLVVGGYNPQQGWLADAELYDPLANAWTVVAPLQSHGVQHTATLLTDGRVLVVGGCVASGVCTDWVELFDPHTNTWTAGAPVSMAAASHAAVLLQNGRVLIAGGNLVGSGALVYDPQADTWTATGPMHTQHAQAAAIKLLDGRVLVTGGINNSPNPVVSGVAEIYDPASNTWTLAASLTQPRYGHRLALLPDGQVLAVGGAHEYDHPDRPWTADSFSKWIECYDPAADRWYTAAELPLPVVSAAVVLLPENRLWLTGGGADSGSAKAWAKTWVLSPLPDQP